MAAQLHNPDGCPLVPVSVRARSPQGHDVERASGLAARKRQGVGVGSPITSRRVPHMPLNPGEAAQAASGQSRRRRLHPRRATGPARRCCCSARTWRCTRPSAAGSATSCSSPAWPGAPATGCRPRRSCGPRSTAAGSSFTTSPSSTCARGRSSGPRRWCAGRTRTGGSRPGRIPAARRAGRADAPGDRPGTAGRAVGSPRLAGRRPPADARRGKPVGVEPARLRAARPGQDAAGRPRPAGRRHSSWRSPRAS